MISRAVVMISPSMPSRCRTKRCAASWRLERLRTTSSVGAAGAAALLALVLIVWSPPCLARAGQADARVEHCVADIGEEIGDPPEEGDQQDHRQDHRVVAREGARHEEAAQAGDAE